MNFNPPFPTDNLYKFIAIFGLFIIGISLVFMNDNTRDFATKTLDMEAELGMLEVETLSLENDVEELRKDIDVTKADLNKEGTSTKPLDKGMAQQYIVKSEELTKRVYQMRINKVKFDSKRTQVKFLKEALGRSWVVFLGTLLSGVFMTILGFVLWYQRTQKYLDVIIKNQANGMK